MTTSSHRSKLILIPLWPRILPWLGLIVIVALAFGLRSYYLWTKAMIYDEGHWLMFAVLANRGYTPYTVTFVGIPPLTLLTIQLSAWLFDITQAVRYPMMLFSLLGMGAIYLSFQPGKGMVNLGAGFMAALFLTCDKQHLRESISLMGEVPAISLALVSLVLLQTYYTKPRKLWLFLAGITFGLSLALKIFVVFFPALAGLLILLTTIQRHGRLHLTALKEIIWAGLIWGVGVMAPWGIFLSLYDPQAMYREVFLFRLVLREVSLSQNAVLLENWGEVSQMMWSRWPLLVGALLGGWWGRREHRLGVWSWAAWLIFAMPLLVWHTPLRPRYSLILLPPLAALTGLGVVYSIRWVVRFFQQKGLGRVSQVSAVLLLTGVIWPTLSVPVDSLARPPDPYIFPYLNFDALDYVKQTSLAADCIITDDQRFALAANRLVPPALSETSAARISAGWLTTDDVINEVQKNDCPAVVYMSDYFTTLPSLSDTLRDLYFLEIIYNQSLVIYTGKKQVNRPPAIPLEVQLTPAITLKGIDLSPLPWSSDRPAQLATYWLAHEQPPRAYKIWVELRDSQNKIIASADYFPFAAPNDRYGLPLPDTADQYNVLPHLGRRPVTAQDIAVYPAKGMLPTNVWPVGQTIREVTTLSWPPLPPGVYGLYLGWYDPDAAARPGDTVRLTQVEVAAPK